MGSFKNYKILLLIITCFFIRAAYSEAYEPSNVLEELHYIINLQAKGDLKEFNAYEPKFAQAKETKKKFIEETKKSNEFAKSIEGLTPFFITVSDLKNLNLLRDKKTKVQKFYKLTREFYDETTLGNPVDNLTPAQYMTNKGDFLEGKEIADAYIDEIEKFKDKQLKYTDYLLSEKEFVNLVFGDRTEDSFKDVDKDEFAAKQKVFIERSEIYDEATLAFQKASVQFLTDIQSFKTKKLEKLNNMLNLVNSQGS